MFFIMSIFFEKFKDFSPKFSYFSRILTRTGQFHVEPIMQVKKNPCESNSNIYENNTFVVDDIGRHYVLTIFNVILGRSSDTVI